MKDIDNIYCIRYLNKESLKRDNRDCIKMWNGQSFCFRVYKIVGITGLVKTHKEYFSISFFRKLTWKP